MSTRDLPYRRVSQTPALPAVAGAARIDILTLVRLREGPDPVATSRIRAAQLCAGRELALFLLGANLIGAAITAMLFAAELPVGFAVAWGALVGAVGLAVTFRRLETTAPRRRATCATPRSKGSGWPRYGRSP